MKMNAAAQLGYWNSIELNDDGSLRYGNMDREKGHIVYVDPTQSELDEIDALAATLQAEHDSSQWSRDRKSEYLKKSTFEQIEMMADGTFDAWYSGIKSNIPKPA